MEVDSLTTMSTYSVGAAAAKPAEHPKTSETAAANEAPVVKADNQSKVSDANSPAAKPEAVREEEVDITALDKAIEKANRQLYSYGREFNYTVHEKTRQISLKILDRESKEVIREIPPEKTLDAIAKMWELAGILVDEKR